MKSLWSDRDANAYVRRCAKRGIGKERALTAYATRLIGGDPRLVLHGGGNSSVKTVERDLLGERIEAVWVKGSGVDMKSIDPEGFTPLRLHHLRRLRGLTTLADADLLTQRRAACLDAGAPEPSVEAMLHVFLPAKVILHSHASAVLALTDQADGAKRIRALFGDRLGVVGYRMPGFGLGKLAIEAFDADPTVEGLVLMKHGLVTFGETAKQAYARMIRFATLAEKALAKGKRKVPAQPRAVATAAEVAPILRGVMGAPLIAALRDGRAVMDYVNRPDLAALAARGVVTPDHVIRTRAWPLVLPAPKAGDLAAFKAEAATAAAAFVENYRAYGARCGKTPVDPHPRVALVPGVGLFGFGPSARDAGVAADIAEEAAVVISAAQSIGRFAGPSEAEMYEVETWNLELAKLGDVRPKAFTGKVAVVTGGASGIGAATARAFAAEGAEVAVLDLDARAAREFAATVSPSALGLGCDVTDPKSIRAAFDAVVRAFGGVDVAVSNAGAAWQGRVGTVDAGVIRKSFELNFFAHQTVSQNAVRIMTAQGLGGCLLFNTSKQAINPGKDFGPYGLPKAATLFLMKQYALDHGKDGIRANAVNADRIRSGLLTDDMIKARAKARGVSEANYMGGNLLGREVTAEDVAQAFVFLAKAPSTTAATLTVDGGNIEASLR